MLLDPQEMMAAYFTGVLDTAGSNRLADWINESQENARAFAQFAVEHHAMEHLLRIEKYGDIASLSQHDFAIADGTSEEPAELDELKLLSMMEEKIPLVPVVLEEPAEASHTSEGTIAPPLQRETGPRIILIPRPVAWSAAAAMVLIALFITWQFIPQQHDHTGNRPIVQNEIPQPVARPIAVASIEGHSDPKWLDGHQRQIGDALPQGDYRLSEGTIRLRFNNGALVHIESPSRFSLNSDSVMTLEEGCLVSHCSTEAHGFCVRTPFSDFIDLGTEFGVLVTPWQEAQLHVFKGKVQAVLTNTHDSHSINSRTVLASEAVAIGPIHRQAIQPLTKADPELFQTVRRRAVASLNTGAMMDHNGQDRQWLVTKINQQPLDPPLPAVLFVPPTKSQLKHGPVSKLPEPIFLPNRPSQLCWIKPDPSLIAGDIQTSTYTAFFDLEGYQASTAKLEIGFNADNYVSSISLNGQPLPVKNASNNPPYVELNQIKTEHGFLPGRNRIEIVVANGKPKIRPTYTGLIAQLSVTAQPNWTVATNEEESPN